MNSRDQKERQAFILDPAHAYRTVVIERDALRVELAQVKAMSRCVHLGNAPHQRDADRAELSELREAVKATTEDLGQIRLDLLSGPTRPGSTWESAMTATVDLVVEPALARLTKWLPPEGNDER